MATSTHTHWRMTINNYDATDLALIQQGYPEFIRQLVYTLEKGENETPHIQAYIRMKRDCRLSFMKRLFPRGNFGALTSAEYTLNSQRYAQKLDSTAESPATITNWEPILTVEGLVKMVADQVISRIRQHLDAYSTDEFEDFLHGTAADRIRWQVEDNLVLKDYKYAKVFVSSTYKQMWKEYGRSILLGLYAAHTHTHTHSDEIFSHAEGIPCLDEQEEQQDAQEDAQEKQ